MLKRTISVLLTLCLLCNVFAVASAALVPQEELLCIEIMEPKYYDSDADCRNSLDILASVTDTAALERVLTDGFSALEAQIDLTSFSLLLEYRSYLSDFIWYCMPLAFHVGSLQVWSSGSRITRIGVEYRDFADTESEYNTCLSAVENAADAILDGIEENTALTDTEKALLLHDRLALWNEYDYTDSGNAKYTAYGALGLRRSVCQGYAMAYMYLLDRAGIESYYCASDALNHGWNIVLIDGAPYHTDVTWDDRSWGTDRGYVGYVEHDNFLRSTDGIVATGHTADDFDDTPTDTTYDNYYWQTSNAAFQLLNGELYYIDHSNAAIKKAGTSQVLCSVQDIWTAGGGYFWQGNYTCLASDSRNLLFSKSDGVYKLNAADGSTQQIFTPDLQTDESVFGFAYENNELICDINTTPNTSTNLRQARFAYEVVAECAHKNTKSTQAIPATCTQVGYTAGEYCPDCETYVSGGTVLPIDTSAHTWDDGVITTVADCSTLGIRTHTCIHDASHTNQVNLGLNADKHTDTRVEAQIPATCTQVGYTAGVYCEGCDTYISGHTEIPALAHKYKYAVSGIAPTCTTQGRTAGEYCPDCETYVSGGTVLPIDTSAHTWDDGVISTVASCSTLGIRTYTCIHDASHTNQVNLGLNADNHTNTRTVAAVAPTVSAVGFTQGVYCDDCETFISGHEEIPILPSISFVNGETAKKDGDNIRICTGMTTDVLLAQANEGAYILKTDGVKLTSDEKPTTGMMLVLSETEQYVLVMPGDADGDAAVGVSDARLALRAAVGLENYDENGAVYKACNVNGDKIEPSDAREILRAAVGLTDAKQWMQ